MKKTLWTVVAVLLVLLTAGSGFSAYYVHKLPFDHRLDCATGAELYLFLPRLCRAYIKAFYPGDTPEDREQLSAGLNFLLAGYEIEEGGPIPGSIADRSLELADLFIRRGADANFVDEHGLTPLHAAVLDAEPVLIKFLFRHGAQADKRTFIPQIGEALSPLELARKIDEEGSNYEDWNKIIALLEAEI